MKNVGQLPDWAFKKKKKKLKQIKKYFSILIVSVSTFLFTS